MPPQPAGRRNRGWTAPEKMTAGQEDRAPPRTIYGSLESLDGYRAISEDATGGKGSEAANPGSIEVASGNEGALHRLHGWRSL